jgi:long-chain acyl-CoA synthetase
VIIPGFRPDLALEVMERERVTATLLIPTMINFLIHHPDVKARDLSTLRCIAYGGAPMPAGIGTTGNAGADLQLYSSLWLDRVLSC